MTTTMDIKSSEFNSSNVNRIVLVHPTILLNVVDHYERTQKKLDKRVAGIILGSTCNNVIEVRNSFAVPFDEEDGINAPWFMDPNYIEDMAEMCYKVDISESIIGWYHSGEELSGNDMSIQKFISRFTKDPILLIVNTEPRKSGIPVKCYCARDNLHDDSSLSKTYFYNLNVEITAEEAEDIGIEHLMRDVCLPSNGQLARNVYAQVDSLRELYYRLVEIEKYLKDVTDGTITPNRNILFVIQELLNTIITVDHEHVSEALYQITNTQMLCIFIASLSRAALSTHKLLENRLKNMQDFFHLLKERGFVMADTFVQPVENELDQSCSYLADFSASELD